MLGPYPFSDVPPSTSPTNNTFVSSFCLQEANGTPLCAQRTAGALSLPRALLGSPFAPLSLLYRSPRVITPEVVEMTRDDPLTPRAQMPGI